MVENVSKMLTKLKKVNKHDENKRKHENDKLQNGESAVWDLRLTQLRWRSTARF